MQATQSNNASEFRPPSSSPSSYSPPSPLSAPPSSSKRPDSYAAVPPDARSIEAGLGYAGQEFHEFEGNGTMPTEQEERLFASLEKSGETGEGNAVAVGPQPEYEPHPGYTYAVPDDDAVRAAIYRLTRESGKGQKRQLQAAQIEVSDSASLGSSMNGDALTASPLPIEFEDVARWVWSDATNEMSRTPAIAMAPEPLLPKSLLAESASKPQPAIVPTVAVSGMQLQNPETGVSERSALAHDARNLLAALGLYSDLLCLQGVLNSRHRHYADDLKLLTGRSQVLIARLLKLSGTGTSEDLEGVVPWISSELSGAESTCLAELLTRWSGALAALAHGALDIHLGSRGSLPVPIAGEKMERILVNLVRNATSAIRDGGAIRIVVGVAPGAAPEAGGKPVLVGVARQIESVAKPHLAMGETIVLTVDDSGCGMTEEQVRGILSPGQQHPAEREPQPKGHTERGLGLRIVRELVAESGGVFSLQSRSGVGTRIEIRWPKVEAGASSLKAGASPGAMAGFSEEEIHALTRRLHRSGEIAARASRTAAERAAGQVEGAIAC